MDKEREREKIRRRLYWNGVGLKYKKCAECYYMPSNPAEDRCARTDKQVRMPDLVWDCEGFEGRTTW